MAPSVPATWSDPSDLLPPSVRAVIFDNDGTLVDTMPAHHAAFLTALAPYSLVFSSAQFYALAGAPLGEILTLISAEQGRPVPPADAVAAAKSAAMADMHSSPPIACVVAVLAEARRRGLKVAVASGGRRENVVRSLFEAGVVGEEEGVEGVFDAVVCAEDVKRGKPHPETFLLAAKAMGVDPADCLGLEDADLGMKALAAAGMAAVDVRLHPEYPRKET